MINSERITGIVLMAAVPDPGRCTGERRGGDLRHDHPMRVQAYTSVGRIGWQLAERIVVPLQTKLRLYQWGV